MQLSSIAQKGENMRGRMRDEYDSYSDERKIECLDYIIEVWLDRELSYQRRMSMIADAIREYIAFRSY